MSAFPIGEELLHHVETVESEGIIHDLALALIKRRAAGPLPNAVDNDLSTENADRKRH
ncbi:hypothetical protein LJR221_001486 [Agrobacterium tumefaciens]